MEKSLNLSLEQKLQQKLSPLQVRFVRMLEMTGPEVEEEVRREVDDNPALEISDESTDNDTHEEPYNESAEELQLSDYKDEDDIPSYRLDIKNSTPGDIYYEPVAVSGGDSLMESLLGQISLLKLSPRDKTVAEFIIGNIDDNGYLTRSLPLISDDIAIQGGIDVSSEKIRAIFDIVRSLEPAGVGAIDLRDCLLLQLKRRHPSAGVRLATEIVTHYFDLFSKMHYDRLLAALDIDEAKLKEAVAVIRSLHPKPGALISGNSADDATRHITPDFAVDVDGDNVILTMLNSIPHLQVEETFNIDDNKIPERLPRQKREAFAFLRRKRDEAADFIKIIGMRQETLYRVMKAIIKLQREFFLTDDETKLRPMILKDVAALTGYDLSVISRATAGKYVATRQGIYPLKFFFNERPKEDNDTSSIEIMTALRKIVDSEDKRHPLSDEALTSKLVGMGYDIARRTVAKYREKASIPVARLRKEI